MSRTKELLVLVLDVGESMRMQLEWASRALFSVVNSKLINKPSHEVGIVFYGTKDTNNSLHLEMRDGGSENQYMNINTVKALGCPDLEYLSALEGAEIGGEVNDFLDALIVAIDMIIKKVERDSKLEKANKKIVLVSNFQAESQPLDEGFQDQLVKSLNDKDIKLDVVCIDFGESDQPYKAKNVDTVKSLISQVHGQLRIAKEPAKLVGAFTAKDVSSTTMYRGSLSLATNLMTINVRVYKKTSKEACPSLKKYSDKSTAVDAGHEVLRETEYKLQSNPDEYVPPEERVKAYKYGKQNVPLSPDDENSVMYHPDRGFHILGFVNAAQVPRHHYMKDSFMVLPEQDGKSGIAMSALCRAMRREDKVGIVRAVLRARSNLFLGVLSPQEGDGSTPDCFVMNALPFMEDIRYYTFQSFAGGKATMPTEEQLAAAQKVIDSMDLTEGGEEQLRPETTVNPTLNRFYTLVGQKALDPDAQLPKPDLLVDKTLDPQYEKFPDALEALKTCTELFTLVQPEPKSVEKREEGKGEYSQFRNERNVDVKGEEVGRSAVEGVGASNPIEDFNVMYDRGEIDGALKGLMKVICSIVESSVGDKLYGKAIECLERLREASVHSMRPREFNEFMQEFRSRFREDDVHSGVWASLTEKKITLISNGECAGAGVSQQEADNFVAVHVLLHQDVAMEDKDDLDDEFEGME